MASPVVNHICYGQCLVDAIDLRAVLFHGLSDPSRQRIIDLLRSGSARVTDVVTATGMSQPNASTHLACLWECGLAERERRGREVHYSLADGVEELLGVADSLLDRAGDRILSCPNYGRGRRREAA
jgi:ArsR family transcriptional regulator, cadmium/lead-responsive transcriptional repressor